MVSLVTTLGVFMLMHLALIIAIVAMVAAIDLVLLWRAWIACLVA